MIICYTVPEIWHMTNVIVIFHFVLFFVYFVHILKANIKIDARCKPFEKQASRKKKKSTSQKLS